MKRLWEISQPIRGKMFAGLLVTLLAAITSLAMPQILAFFVDRSVSANATATTVLVAATVLAGIGVLDASLIWLRRVLVVDPATRLEYRMRLNFFSRLQRLHIGFHDSWQSGQLLSRSMSDMQQVRRWMSFTAIMLINDIFMITVGVVLMARANGWLALIYLCGAIPLIAVIFLMSRRLRVLGRRAQDQAGDVATNVEQSVHGIRVLKAFGRGDHALTVYSGYAARVRDTEVTRGKVAALFDSAVTLLPELALGAALIVGLFMVGEGELSVAGLSAFFATAMLLAMPVAMIGLLIADTLSAITALNRIDEVTDTETDIHDPADPVEIDVDTVRGELVFHDVDFRYPVSPTAEAGTQNEMLLNDLSVHVRAGETMALVGVTGSGKSSLIQLVPRMYDVTDGSITIDGIDIRDMRLTDLRRIVAVAFEDPTLFSGSVRENVLLGVDEADVPEEAERTRILDQALRTADADFVYRLPEGVDTLIGEEGLSLSGGQRQRLAVARAIAARPTVLVMDDPLSALDTATEERVTAGLAEVLSSTTTLIVAHRTSTVALADRVALLDEGRIVAVGTHAELLDSHERYRFVLADLDDRQPQEGGSRR